MNDIELRREVLLSMQQALWGMIHPAIRAVAVGYEGTRKLKITYYLDREPESDDYENIREVSTAVCADIPFSEVEEICVYTKDAITTLDPLASWVYVRKE